MLILKPVEFEWDIWNTDKNWKKHKVSNREAEEAILDENAIIFKDKLHSGKEIRHILIGVTSEKRILFIVFTIRNKKLRVISARDLNKKERRFLI